VFLIATLQAQQVNPKLAAEIAHIRAVGNQYQRSLAFSGNS
jgi:hypothetical protein